MNKNNITLLASFATDRLLDKQGNLVSEKPGGPAFFIQKVLEEEKMTYNKPYSPALNVEILITPEGEYGKVKTKTKPIKIEWQSLDTPVTLISTILDDYSLEGIERYPGQIFLDIQGYVRNGKQFGQKKRYNLNISSIKCLKGTEEETSYLPNDFVQKQKEKILLITLSSKGSTLYFQNKAFNSQPNKTVKTKDTLGAGDSFFAYFVANYLRSNNPLQSLEYATSKTTAFLSLKTSYEENV